MRKNHLFCGLKISSSTLRLACVLAGIATVLHPTTTFAGQSLVIRAGNPPSRVADAPLAASQPWRIEFQLHDFTASASGGQKIFYFGGTGAIATIYPDRSINLDDLWDAGEGGAPCRLPTGDLVNVLVRYQRDLANGRTSCELWNYDGTGYASQTRVLGSSNNYNPGGGGADIGLGASAALGFLRVFTEVVPMGSRPPTTGDASGWTELKLDGNLSDSSGRGHGYTGPQTGLSFVQTPNQVAIALPKTYGAPSWSNWVSLRAGFPATLDGTASYSLADGSSAVTYSWQQTDGPTTLIWSSRSAATPAISGLVFGTYKFRLKVSDANGSSSTADLVAGAVATDENGVVINADPNVDKLFGPMIAFGRNPWGFADERAMTATKLRSAAYHAKGLDAPSWATPQAGTIDYMYDGANGPQVTTLAADIAGPTANTISVADASRIDLSTLPTRILVGVPYRQKEDIRICAASTTSGPAILTVCYDGRGQANPLGETYRTKAQSWPAGTQVWQMKVKGSGTDFLSTLCPAGVGPAGTILYNAGTAALSQGSAVVVGSDTNWSNANGIYPNDFIVRVTATHAGSPFVFYAYIAAITDTTHLILARPYPADADSGTFSYSIIRADNRFATLHYTRTVDGSDAQYSVYAAGCESPTSLYLWFGSDLGGIATSAQTGKQYSYMDGTGYLSAFGPNFYGEDLAHRALYYRSGWDFALQTARVMGDTFVRSPTVAGSDAGGIPLLLGGGVIGGFASAILDSAHHGHTAWSDLRGFARISSVGNSTCSAYDTRDSSYLSAFVALAAGFDPDPLQRATWKTKLSTIYDRELRCKQSDNSWAQGFLWGQQTGPLTMTRGNTVVSGSNLPQALCFGISSGQITVTNGSALAAPSGPAFVRGNQIVITGTANGTTYTGFFQFTINPDGTALLAALWPGDSGTFSYVIENNDSKMAIGTSNDDPQLAKEWACTWNSPSQITLNRPWDGPSVSNAYAWSGLLAGYGQQPFMMGIKTTELKFASLTDDPSLSSGFAALVPLAATWIHDVGYDPVTNGLHYGRVFESCEPQTTPPPGSSFVSRTPICDSGLDPASIRAARVLTAEASQALTAYYQSNPAPEVRSWGDKAYGSIWGNPTLTSSSVYSDSNFVRDENSDASLGAYKWTGFFFGMGMAHQWPAARLGGVAPPRYRTVYITLNRGAADSAEITVTSPSGAVNTYQCSVARACAVQVDDRQGGHWFKIRYLAGSQVLSETEPDLLTVPPVFP